jgi:hypothetical protein
MAPEECWKKNHLERNAEVDVMILTTTRNFARGVGLRFRTPGR